MYAENLQEQNELFESQIKAQKKTMNVKPCELFRVFRRSSRF